MKTRCKECGREVEPGNTLCPTCYGISIQNVEIISGHKRCTKCGEVKRKREFNKTPFKDNLHPWCKFLQREARIRRYYGKHFPNVDMLDKIRNKTFIQSNILWCEGVYRRPDIFSEERV